MTDNFEEIKAFNDEVARRAAKRVAAIAAMAVRGMKYETFDGYSFKVFAPIAGGKSMSADEILEYLEDR